MRCRILLFGCWLLIGVAHCNAYDERLLQPTASSLFPAGDAGPADGGTRGLGNGAMVPGLPPPPEPMVTRCGDGVISGLEKCDTGIAAGVLGACPTQCPRLAPCAQRVLNGTACQAECVVLEPSCSAGDECCPGNCSVQNDADCSAKCGDGTIETQLGETCEASVYRCAESDADCDDSDPCTQDRLSGGAKNCNSMCTHTAITERKAGDGCCPSGANATLDTDCAAVCGNAVREPGEDCDGEQYCGPDCKWQLTEAQITCLTDFATTDCQRCSCLLCTDLYLACRDSGSARAQQLCSNVMDCTEREQCEGQACYCSDPPVCASSRPPCRDEIEAAVGVAPTPFIVGAQSNDPSTPLGRANAADSCKLTMCREACTGKPTAMPD